MVKIAPSHQRLGCREGHWWPVETREAGRHGQHGDTWRCMEVQMEQELLVPALRGTPDPRKNLQTQVLPTLL